MGSSGGYTAAYCNIVLSQSRETIDTIYYPSVPFQKQGVNFAFNDSFSENADVQLLDVLRSKFLVTEHQGLKSFIEVHQQISKPFNVGAGIIEWS